MGVLPGLLRRRLPRAAHRLHAARLRQAAQREHAAAVSPESFLKFLTGSLWNFATFQVVWLACVAGAAAGNGWIGPVAAGVAVGLHLATTRGEHRARELALLVVVAVVGTLVDSGVQASGALRYALHPEGSFVEPAWVIALWFAFATLLRRSLAWLGRRPLLAVVLGAVGGPLSARAGASLGAVELGPDLTWSFGVIAFEWALLTPAFLVLARAGSRREQPVRFDEPSRVPRRPPR